MTEDLRDLYGNAEGESPAERIARLRVELAEAERTILFHKGEPWRTEYRVAWATSARLEAEIAELERRR